MPFPSSHLGWPHFWGEGSLLKLSAEKEAADASNVDSKGNSAHFMIEFDWCKAALIEESLVESFEVQMRLHNGPPSSILFVKDSHSSRCVSKQIQKSIDSGFFLRFEWSLGQVTDKAQHPSWMDDGKIFGLGSRVCSSPPTKHGDITVIFYQEKHSTGSFKRHCFV